MPEGLDPVFRAIDEQHADKPAATRRQMVAGAAAALGGMGLLGLPAAALATPKKNTTENILNVAATAEVLATIVNTVGAEKVSLDGRHAPQRPRGARHELEHYKVLVDLGGSAITKRIWVPDAVFSGPVGLLSTLEVGDQIFINAYLIAVRTFGNGGKGELANVAAQFMGVEAVHRALARQSLGKLGNDRVFMKYDGRETAPEAPNKGQAGFRDVLSAARQLEQAGFGLGRQGATPGRFYEFDVVRRRTPRDPDVNTFLPDASN